MKTISVRNKSNLLFRVVLIFLLSYLQLFFPVTDLTAETNSVDSGIVSTPEDQDTATPGQFPFVPGDAILLSTYPDTSSFLNGIYPIDDQGYIEFPIGERINISRMSSDIFLQYLRDNYQNYMRSPNLYVKPMIRLTVVGGFVIPGMYYVDDNMSLWDVIKLAGGASHEGAIKDINWERNGEKVVDDVTPYLERGVSLKNIGFQSGDLVWAPSPDAEDTWDFVATRILPAAAFVTSVYLMWISYQTMVLIARGR
jgi:protein involved in polysaccharide export with SLBB domain